jgi:hypothetical protein
LTESNTFFYRCQYLVALGLEVLSGCDTLEA